MKIGERIKKLVRVLFRNGMGFFKNALMKQMMKRQLKNVPVDQQEKILAAIEKDPQFFEDIAKKIEQKTKEGKDQMSAAM